VFQLHCAVGKFASGDRAVGHAGRHQGVADRGDARVGRELLLAVYAVIEPDAQAHVGVREDSGRDGRHPRVPEHGRIKALGHREGDGPHTVAPVGGSTRAVHQREAELARAVEIRAPGTHPALIVQESRHLLGRNRPGDKNTRQCDQTDYLHTPTPSRLETSFMNMANLNRRELSLHG
jgi:hypothetical protein